MNPDIPTHVGIILDGNRRWAIERGLPTLRGHAKGQQTLRTIARHAFKCGVKYLSVYAFSTENWKRSIEEVNYLMRHISSALRKYLKECMEDDIKIVVLGSREGLSSTVLKTIEKAEATTANNQSATVAICLNYGGHQEIVDAAKSVMREGIEPDTLTTETFAQHLYHPEVPPIDLLIRTSGEQRISNYMLWRAAYAELMFTDTYWPDFSTDELDLMLEAYASRHRRFGG